MIDRVQASFMGGVDDLDDGEVAKEEKIGRYIHTSSLRCLGIERGIDLLLA